METYKNSYSVQEDEVLWELHEIRHRLHRDLAEKDLKEINREALRKFREWTVKGKPTVTEKRITQRKSKG
jgi:hypothetical protein